MIESRPVALQSAASNGKLQVTVRLVKSKAEARAVEDAQPIVQPNRVPVAKKIVIPKNIINF